MLRTVKLAGIRAITFDATGTLIEPHPSVGHGLAVEEAGLDRRFRAQFAARRSLLSTDETVEKAFWRGLAGEVFAPWADAATVDRFYPELWAAFAEARRWRPRTDVARLFATLRERGVRLAILSNWDARLHRVVDGLGWRPQLDGVFISSELGVQKPDRRAFDRAAGFLGAAPHELLHVGDSWTHDVAGARGAGWQAAWLSGRGEDGPDPDVLRLTTLDELPERLA